MEERKMEEREMKEYQVKEDLLQAILNYLGQRPYVEVEGMIQALIELTKGNN